MSETKPVFSMRVALELVLADVRAAGEDQDVICNSTVAVIKNALLRSQDERVRHVKRGGEYEVLFRGVELQATTVLENEGVGMVIYRGADGKLWTRSEDEFDDGRFVPAP